MHHATDMCSTIMDSTFNGFSSLASVLVLYSTDVYVLCFINSIVLSMCFLIQTPKQSVHYKIIQLQ